MITKVTGVKLIDSGDYKGVWYNRYEIETSWLTHYNNTYVLYLKFGHEPPNVGNYYSYDTKNDIMVNVKLEPDFDETNISGSSSEEIMEQITRSINGGGQVA
jgi:hypothetical protein